MEKILLAHGGGGLLTEELIRTQIVSRFSNAALDELGDAASLPAEPGRVAFTTDSYVVSPVFFPGGCIGDLAVCGTVNDLAMSGARPCYLSLGLILEEGFPAAELERILDAVKARADEAGVNIVTGDTKVVPKGMADGIYMNTAGIGWIAEGVEMSAKQIRPGDVILVSGAVGLHGVAVMLARGNLSLETPVQSDVAALHRPAQALLEAGVRVRVMRDLTRGGLSMALYGLAEASHTTMELREADVPVNAAQAAACDILGLDPLHVACEGRFLAVVDQADAEKALGILRSFPVSDAAAVAGRVLERTRHATEVVTSIGSRRVLSPPRGEQMPRIC